MSPENRTFYLGTSGWAHRDWVGQLYAHDLPPADYLSTYAQQFDTVEIEHTFFDQPTREMVQSWHRRTPAAFIFSPCLPRRLTHEQKLRDVRTLLEEFLAVMVDLGDKLGPILVQLPPDFRRREQRHLETFLHILPRDLDFAIEFHHGSWLNEAVFALLESYGVAWVVVDAPFLPRVARVTADFAYVRWHGRPGVGQRTKRQLDPTAFLRPWGPILRDLARQTQRVYGYVRNSFSGYAPRDCHLLSEILGDTEDV